MTKGRQKMGIGKRKAKNKNPMKKGRKEKS